MWSRIQNTELDVCAYMQINDNLCEYHNNDHVNSMYEFLDEKEIPYDEALDWAILFHDVIYDNQPNKEKRSAELFLDQSKIHRGCNLDDEEKQRVYDLIMATETHLIDDGDRKTPLKGKKEIIMSDLHQLTSPKQTIINYGKIMSESMELYGITEFEFARNSINFMQGLRETMVKNIKRSDTIEEKAFFHNVIEGININILISKAVI